MVTSELLDERLRPFEAVTDARLVGLDLDDLLGHLLDQVRDLLGVDSAVVLLLDGAKQFLVATAARGIEGEVHQGVRVPVGKGFAGRVAARKRPMVVDDVSRSVVLNPLIKAAGLHSLLGVPLAAGGTVVGVLHVGMRSLRHFTDEDVSLLQMVGDRIALAVRASTSSADRAAAAALQRSLWPSGLPMIPGLEFSARYVPAGVGEVGGDWYDVLAMPSGWTWVVIGDVAGRGLPAAVAMGRLRSALRAYTMEGPGPADILRRLDLHLRQFDPDVMATVLCALVSPDCARIQLSSAGHPAPVVSASVEIPAAFIELDADLPLGVNPARPRHTTRMVFPPGAALCLYTDGLVERRATRIEDGMERVRRSVFAGAPESVCAAVMADLVGDSPVEDDVAMLVMRRQTAGEMGPLDVRVPAVPASVLTIRNATRRWLGELGVSSETSSDLIVAIGEAVTNVIEHAYGPRGGDVYVHLAVSRGEVVAMVRDTGRWRPPRGRSRGRGAMLMQGLADGVHTERTDTGTKVVIRKKIIRSVG
ncbi:MAG TPA: SpoIIE family protein phosphatase [Pseudonocardia sp.]|jgi:anti-sigma regulatory factor (Ser/Thr protein kinase)|nr:SpoIIE family protein phosphatase [Pseudonocardia sp.]